MSGGQRLRSSTVRHTDRTVRIRCTNDNLAEHILAVKAGIPDIEVIPVGEPDLNASPLGGKSVGEIGVVGIATGIANAVCQ